MLPWSICPLNEGRSVNPGYTPRQRTRFVRMRSAAQRRPERQPRLHPTTSTSMDSIAFEHPLNEGRSVNPGYTERRLQAVDRRFTSPHAQRRPERQPRLHQHRGAGPAATARGDAQRRPERQPRLHPRARPRQTRPYWSAQRRPERQPRLHLESLRAETLPEPRSTKAGASTPATPEDTNLVSPNDSGQRTLNEGRSVNPGDTSDEVRSGTMREGHVAQRRPERQPRLHC